VANRIVEILPQEETPGNLIDRMMPFDDYLRDSSVKQLRTQAYRNAKGLRI
jgi:hypothetical protein